MKHSRLIAFVAALALAASPLTWARSSGFSSSHSSFSSSSHSSFSSSGSSSSGRTSGFGSGSSSGSRSSSFTSTATSTAAARPATTGLGSALYSANAGKAAANTYATNKAATSGGYSSGGGAGYSGSKGYSGGYGGGSTYVYHNAPAPLVVNHYHNYNSGSSNGFFWGWMLGHSDHPDTVIVQQPGYVQPQYGVQYAPQAGGTTVMPSGVQPQGQTAAWDNASQPGAQNVNVPAQNQAPSHGFLHFLIWVAVLGGVAFLAWKLLSSWSSRKAGYTATNHYKL